MNKRHFLLCMWEGGGTVPPELGLARKLIARGHVVDVLGDPTIEAEARDAGCGFLPWQEAPSVKERTPEAALVRDWEHKSISQTLHEYVGPVLDDPTWAPSAWESPWPRENSDPIVLVGFSSTFQNQGAVVRRCVEAFSSLPVRGIVTLGEQLDVSEFASTPNVVVTRSAPHGLILDQAAAIITHCGHGTAMKAMHAGVPAVCIPMGRDQNDTAARIVARGAGIRIKSKASTARIAEAVRLVLTDPTYREGARALGARIRAELAVRDPADALLESLHHGRDISMPAFGGR